MTTVFYHQVKPGIDCPDGIAAAWVVSQAYPDADFQGVCYQTAPPKVQDGDTLIVVDFCFPVEVLQSWRDRGCRIILLDHHKTALQDVSQFARAIADDLADEALAGNSTPPTLALHDDRISLEFDMNECGATIAWRHFFPDRPMPAFLEFVRDRDLWLFEIPETRAMHEAIALARRNKGSRLRDKFCLFGYLAKLSKQELIEIYSSDGEKLLEQKRERCRAIASRATHQFLPVPNTATLWDRLTLPRMSYLPFVYLTADESRLHSDIMELMHRDLFPNAPLVGCLMSHGEVSLRSRKDGGADVSAIARRFGGGGHHNAAGYRIVAD